MISDMGLFVFNAALCNYFVFVNRLAYLSYAEGIGAEGPYEFDLRCFTLKEM